MVKKIKRVMVEESHEESEEETAAHIDDERPVWKTEPQRPSDPPCNNVASVGAKKPPNPNEQIVHTACHTVAAQSVLGRLAAC